MRLLARDASRIGLCVQGQKRFCEIHGIDFRAFIRGGIDADKLAHIEDANLTSALAVAAEREAEDGRRG